MSGEWREVSKREHCPVCDKPNWCSVVGPEGAIEAAVCMREESANARPNGGWFHRIRESSNWSPPPAAANARTFSTAAEAIAALEKKLGPRSRVWKYFAADGEPVGVVIRWDRQNGNKEIRPISRIGGGWIIGAMPEPRPLYDLPIVSKSPAVIVTEGEKAADAIRSLGVSATTSAGGSSSATKTDWSPLAGKIVAIWPDNDGPGEKYLAAVVAALSKLSPRPTVRIIRPAGQPDKGDAADWLAAGGTSEQLEQLVLHAEPVKFEERTASNDPRHPKQITLRDAAQAYIDRMKAGKTTLIELGIPELDYAIGGGCEFGEMVIAAARPSHGKSAFAMQCGHHWTASGIPTLVISEEMSTLALGKRALQYASAVPLEHWHHSASDLERDLGAYAASRATCIISEPCVTPAAVVESIERNVGEHGVRAVVIDYAQLLRGEGRSKYEQVSFVSNRLREAATKFNVLLLALCQLNREVEKRTKFIPCVSDIRDAGTLEQDADVIMLLAWPNRVDAKQPPNQYHIFVAKNRNRPINQPLVVCRFDPSRQMITESTAREMSNYEPCFEDHDPFNSDF